MAAFTLGVGLALGLAGPLRQLGCCAVTARLAIGDFSGFTLPIFLMVGSGSVGIIARTRWDQRRSVSEGRGEGETQLVRGLAEVRWRAARGHGANPGALGPQADGARVRAPGGGGDAGGGGRLESAAWWGKPAAASSTTQARRAFPSRAARALMNPSPYQPAAHGANDMTTNGTEPYTSDIGDRIETFETLADVQRALRARVGWTRSRDGWCRQMRCRHRAKVRDAAGTVVASRSYNARLWRASGGREEIVVE